MADLVTLDDYKLVEGITSSTKGWPVKVTGPSVKADSNEIGVEELTMAHEYIERVN